MSQSGTYNSGSTPALSNVRFGAVAGDQGFVTGNGVVYTVTFNGSTFFDTASSFAGATGIFTAPITGYYLFCAAITGAGWDGTNTSIQLRLATTARTYIAGFGNIADVSGNFSKELSYITNMSAGDTARVQLFVSSGVANNISIVGANSFFNGALLN